MTFILFDDVSRAGLLPFAHTRPVADIRCGIFTMRERWEHLLAGPTGTLTEDYLQPVFPVNGSEDNIYINGNIFGSAALVEAITSLTPGDKLVKDGMMVAVRLAVSNLTIGDFRRHAEQLQPIEFSGDVFAVRKVWDIFSMNDRAIRADFALITNARASAPIPGGVTVTGNEHLFIEEGAIIYAGCVINASAGPVYIGKNAEILEGTLVRGPLAACDHSVIKMGAKIYGATTIGPGCKVGGEINNTVFFANSNKSHDGYLGNAVIGEWCNLGADTNCSNLKNNYDEVKIWSEAEEKLIPTGLIFCGLMMGDHSKCGINTMFNTGTVVGVSCNLFGGGFPDKYVRSFSWGGSDGIATYDFEKAMETANRMMGRRGLKLSIPEREMYRHIFNSQQSKING